jgi:RimJ/RimL family protein N-acetyltransferase
MTSAVRSDVVLKPSLDREWWPLMWRWLMEDPTMNADEFGPQSEAEYIAQREAMRGREQLWGVIADERPAGFIQYQPISPMLGSMHVCFTRAVRGHGVATTAMCRVRDELIANGVRKLTIAIFSDNAPALALCRRFGAIHEGLLRHHTRTNGRLRDVRLMAIFARAAED